MSELGVETAINRKRYWQIRGMPVMPYGTPNQWLEQQGLLSLKLPWVSLLLFV